MSFKEIKELRQAGKLEEALEMASMALQEDSENIWNKRAIAWIYYDYLKKYAQLETFNEFKENLVKIKDLALPEDEKMVFDNCAWQISKMVYAIQKNEPVDYSKIDDLFGIIREFHFSKPSEGYSLLHKSFHKGYQNWSNYLTFADWWGFENLRSEDYLSEEYNGQKQMSFVEKAVVAYSKKLLKLSSFNVTFAIANEHEKSKDEITRLNNLISEDVKSDKTKVELFLPILERVIKTQPNYQYPPYYMAKLLLALGNNENVLSSFLPFAKQKRNDFWVWELMAEIFSEKKDIQFACYCKALSLKTPEDFLVKLRQTFAAILIEKQMLNEAKTEILKVISTREKHGWKLPNQITQWIQEDWYNSAEAKNDNSSMYSTQIKVAEEILFQDIEEELIAVEFVNENRKILNFVKDKRKSGFFNYSNHLNKPKIGDLLKVRFKGNGQDRFYHILSARLASDLNSDAVKEFEGPLKLMPPNNFGFVEDIFIDPNLIESNSLTDGQILIGKAILSFNKKKNVWGWKAFAVKIKN